MSDQPLTETIKADVKTAMKARDKERLATLRLIQAEFKRIEVDERVEIDDTRALVAQARAQTVGVDSNKPKEEDIQYMFQDTQML